MALVLDDTAIKLIMVAACVALFAGWVGLRRRSRRKGYIRLHESQGFPLWRWLRSGTIGQVRLWVLDTSAHMTFGGVMGMIIALLSMCLFRITVAHYAGITGVSMALDRRRLPNDQRSL